MQLKTAFHGSWNAARRVYSLSLWFYDAQTCKTKHASLDFFLTEDDFRELKTALKRAEIQRVELDELYQRAEAADADQHAEQMYAEMHNEDRP